MIETTFSTDDLPVADRFACWHDMANRSVFRTHVAVEREDAFRASARGLDCGVAQLSYEKVDTPIVADRTTTLIRRSDPEEYLLGMVVAGSSTLAQGERETQVHPGEMVLFDSSRPLRARFQASSHVLVRLPRSVMPIPVKSVHGLLMRNFPSDQGIGSVLSACLRQVVAGTSRYTAVEVVRLAGITLDLLFTLLAHEAEAVRFVPPPQALLARIDAFIRRNLADPALSPATVAAAHHISVRYLYRLFEGREVTVATWIRNLRLDHCRRDLETDDRPVNAVGARWGFPAAAHFSRTFRAHFGLSPAEYRRTVRQ
jgi:AraC-like DNA-binding protein